MDTPQQRTPTNNTRLDKCEAVLIPGKSQNEGLVPRLIPGVSFTRGVHTFPRRGQCLAKHRRGWDSLFCTLTSCVGSPAPCICPPWLWVSWPLGWAYEALLLWRSRRSEGADKNVSKDDNLLDKTNHLIRLASPTVPIKWCLDSFPDWYGKWLYNMLLPSSIMLCVWEPFCDLSSSALHNLIIAHRLSPFLTFHKAVWYGYQYSQTLTPTQSMCQHRSITVIPGGLCFLSEECHTLEITEG